MLKAQTRTDSLDVPVRVPTGIDGLDEVIEGGFPKGSLIVLAGNPGSGKTIFATCFLCKGAPSGDPGVYVSFAESKEILFSNMSRHQHRDCQACEFKENFQFLDLLAFKEGGTPSLLRSIQMKTEETKAGRLVIDSFTDMAQTFRDKTDARPIVHAILNKIARQLQCTTILVAEIPFGEEHVGTGTEEFVADGIIKLGSETFEDRLVRTFEIMKLRGTRLLEKEFIFTLEGGFKIFQPYVDKSLEKPQTLVPIPDSQEKFSTGSDLLDNILGGGYRKGSTVLLEVGKGISSSHYHLLLAPTGNNFSALGRGSLVIPSSGTDYKMIRRISMRGGFPENELDRLLRVCVLRSSEVQKEPYLVSFEGKSLEVDYQQFVEAEERLMSQTDQPVFEAVGYDSLVSVYGAEAVKRTINLMSSRVREKGNLAIVVLKSGYDEASTMLSAISDVHLKITEKHGALITYGIKPRTNMYVLEMDTSKGYVLPKLTLIV